MTRDEKNGDEIYFSFDVIGWLKGIRWWWLVIGEVMEGLRWQKGESEEMSGFIIDSSVDCFQFINSFV